MKKEANTVIKLNTTHRANKVHTILYTMTENDKPITLVYKRVGANDEPIHVDIYSPIPEFPTTSASKTLPCLPALVYFHGGGLTVGNRQSWFPTWLYKRVTAAGYVFVSADYQLLPPATGQDIIRDISDLFAFLVKGDHTTRSELEDDVTRMAGEDDTLHRLLPFTIDPNAIAVTGSSAGGLCAYLAAVHCTIPRPCAVLSLYGMGGNFLSPHYLHPKTEPFFRGRDLLDPTDSSFAPYLYPASATLSPISDVPLVYHGSEHPIPGYPAHPRMLLARLYLQLGVFLDYYTGVPGLSAELRSLIQKGANGGFVVLKMDVQELLERSGVLELFPQFPTPGRRWPPTMLCHGVKDSAVPVGESRHLARILRDSRVEVELLEFEGEEHSFDNAPGAEERYGKEFDVVWKFLERSFKKKV